MKLTEWRTRNQYGLFVWLLLRVSFIIVLLCKCPSKVVCENFSSSKPKDNSYINGNDCLKNCVSILSFFILCSEKKWGWKILVWNYVSLSKNFRKIKSSKFEEKSPISNLEYQQNQIRKILYKNTLYNICKRGILSF